MAVAGDIMNYAPKCKEYLGVDLSPVNVEIVEKQIAESGHENAGVMLGDATDLQEIAFAFINKIGAIAKFGHGVGWKMYSLRQ